MVVTPKPKRKIRALAVIALLIGLLLVVLWWADVSNPSSPEPGVPSWLSVDPWLALTPVLARAEGREHTRSWESCLLQTSSLEPATLRDSTWEQVLWCPGLTTGRVVIEGRPRISWAARADGIRFGGWRGETVRGNQVDGFWDLPAQRGEIMVPAEVGEPQRWRLVPLEWSLPILGTGRAWEPDEARSAIERPLHVAARPIRVEGEAPNSVGGDQSASRGLCELWVRHGRPPAGRRGNCRITLACDGELVLGEGDQGWATCSRDEEGFPAAARIGPESMMQVNFHWTRRELVLEADDWSAEVELVEHPACANARVYRTVAITSVGEEAVRSLSIEEGAASLRLAGGLVVAAERFHEECHSGRVTADFGEFGDYQLEYGWGFEILVGSRDVGEGPVPWVGSLALEGD